MRTMIDLNAQTHVTVNGIKLPMLFRVIRGYAEHQSAHLISVLPIKQGGFQSSVGFWTMLPAVSVRVMLEQDKEQTYTVARNDDGIVSPWIQGLDSQDQIEVSATA